MTQSNSKAARQARHDIPASLLMNREPNPTAVQEAVINYFGLQGNGLIQTGDFWILNPTQLHDPYNYELDFADDEIR